MSKPGSYPTDEHGNALNRAMGLPIVSDNITIGGSHYVDIFDLSAYQDRVFTTIAVDNPDSSNQIRIALGDDFNTNKVITVKASGSLVFDEMTFGYGFVDPISKVRAKKLRAQLSATSGVLATGTIDYSGGGTPIQPTDGMCVYLNGKVYEFSNDLSKLPSSDFIVAIGATADLSWTALKNAISLRVAGGQGDQAIIATINTGTHILTITSEYSGTYGNAIGIADGDLAAANLTGATFSGATLASGSAGITPIIHIY